MKNLIKIILSNIDGAPEEFQVLPDGKIEINGDQPAYLDEAGAASIIAAFTKRGNDMVIDYEHQTLTGKEAPAAGWVKKLVYKGKEGLWASVEWTERARQYLQNKEYRFFSPVIFIANKGRRAIEIANIALTNDPKINNLTPIIAKMAITDPPGGRERKEEGQMLEKLKKLLGLADDAGEDKVEEAVTLLINKSKIEVVACKEILEAVGAKEDSKKDDVLTLISGLKSPADAAKNLSLEVAALKRELSEIKQNDLIQIALKEGKTSPEELDKWGRDLALKNPEQFRLIVLSRPAGSIIPLGQINQAKDKQGAKTDDVQMSINKMMGISEETWKKHGPKV